MAELTDEQRASLNTEMNEMTFQKTILRQNFNKLTQYNSETAELNKVYRLTAVAAIMKVGPTQFQMITVVD